MLKSGKRKKIETPADSHQDGEEDSLVKNVVDEGSDDESDDKDWSGSEEEEVSEESSSSEDEEFHDDSDSSDVDSEDEDDVDVNFNSAPFVQDPRLKVEEDDDEEDEDEREKRKTNEYEYDSSDEEDVRNTIGNIPVEWYDDYKHIGYDIEGRKLMKPEHGDALDEFLDKADNPDFWRTVKNKSTGQKILLSEEDVNQIKNIQASSHPKSSEGLYAPWVDFFTREVYQMPVTGRPPDKRSFIPSKWERQRVGQIVHALKMGWMKPYGEIRKMKQSRDPNAPTLDLWKDDNEPEITKRYRMHIPAPKEPLPGHAESVNPPGEYLFDQEEESKWESQEPEERRMNFKPQKYDAYRSVPSFRKFINERFSRLLDLYLASRQRKMKMQVNPEDLIPQRPDKKDLQPYPTREAMIYRGHTDVVRSISVDPSGQWLASGSDDKTVKLWEISTGRCMKTLKMASKVMGVAWNPNASTSLIAVMVASDVVIINPCLGDKLISTNTDNALDQFEESTEPGKFSASWSTYDVNEQDQGFRLKISHSKEVAQVVWHAKGDYLATVQHQNGSQSVLIHQLSKRQTQSPFSKPKGLVQRVQFHPVHPYLFVATQQHIRIYNLVKQELHRKLQANCKYISSMEVHSGGDNVLVGSYDSRLCWFDLDLSTKPYQTLKYHKKAVRQVAFHKSYPLFASASDDGSIIVSHGKVFTDQLLSPLIVTVKVLRGHKAANHVSVLDCKFHPTQPWVFSSGADKTIRLFV